MKRELIGLNGWEVGAVFVVRGNWLYKGSLEIARDAVGKGWAPCAWTSRKEVAREWRTQVAKARMTNKSW